MLLTFVNVPLVTAVKLAPSSLEISTRTDSSDEFNEETFLIANVKLIG